jgi:phosphate/sulfate permease
LKRWLGKRFDKDEAILENGAAFDMVRAAVNLLLASLLIALGTSLKLPLSTTYVAFMVAMGSSLADKAWGRESAVFRITGVISVIGGWFITAGAAFVATFLLALAIYYGGTIAMVVVVALTILFLIRSNIRYRRKMKAEHEARGTKCPHLRAPHPHIYRVGPDRLDVVVKFLGWIGVKGAEVPQSLREAFAATITPVK